jgi:four helix bundle protein
MRFGTGVELLCHAMGVKRLEDLAAFQLAVSFKLDVYRLIREQPEAANDWRFRSQLFAAAAGVESNIAEGWRRHRAAEMATFLRYARASLAEAERWLHDGVARGYYPVAALESAVEHCHRCGAATTALWKSLQPFIEEKKKGARKVSR